MENWTIEVEAEVVTWTVENGESTGGTGGTTIAVTAGIARFTLGGTTYYFPVSTTSP